MPEVHELGARLEAVTAGGPAAGVAGSGLAVRAAVALLGFGAGSTLRPVNTSFAGPGIRLGRARVDAKPGVPGSVCWVAGDYTIAGGLADARRLARQAQVMQDATAAFLTRAGLAAGTACLDVGCGDGQVTIAMARRAGPRGLAVGVDVDAGALAIAQAAAARAGVRARFVRAEAARLGAAGAFDLVYARLLLSHLIDPCAVLRAMRAAARPGGVVAVEDLNLGTLRSEPPEPALDALQAVYGATVRFHGGDPTIGPRLRALLSASGLDEVAEDTVENPMTTVEEKLFLAELVRNMRAAILAAKAATVGELDDLADSVEAAARDSRTVFYQAHIHQVWGRRPP